MLVLGRSDVEALLDLDALINALEGAMSDVSAGRASIPNRNGAVVEERSALLAAMPGYVPSAGALVAKLVTLFPQNADTALPTHQAIIGCFDPATGTPVALMDGTYITAARTGACSALSARLLAREDATSLAIIGTGVQARSHARAMTRVRQIREVRVAGRDAAKAGSLAAELAAELGLEVDAAGSYREAVAGADIVCATTHSPEPVVRGDWLGAGTHVTSVGYNPEGRELDDEAVGRAQLFVETRQAALAPAPAGSRDLAEPLAAGLISEADVAEIGEVAMGTRPGRTEDGQITIYKSVGVAAQDAAAAALVLAAARAAGAGREVEL